MKKILLTGWYIFCMHFCFAIIGTKLIVTPSAPLNTDTVYVQAVAFYGDFIVLYDDSIAVKNDTVFIHACHLLVSSSIEPPSSDTLRVKLAPLHTGVWTIKYVVHGTDTLNDSSCIFYSQADSTIKTFIVGVAAITELQTSGFSLQMFNGANSNTILLSPSYFGSVSNCNIFLYNSLGQEIRKEYSGSISGQLKIDMKTIDLVPGFYFYEVQIGEERGVLRFVKQ